MTYSEALAKRDKAIALVTAAGLDVKRIRLANITPLGYDEVVMGSAGKALVVGDRYVLVRRRWPKARLGRQVWRLTREWIGYVS